MNTQKILRCRRIWSAPAMLLLIVGSALPQDESPNIYESIPIDKPFHDLGVAPATLDGIAFPGLGGNLPILQAGAETSASAVPDPESDLSLPQPAEPLPDSLHPPAPSAGGQELSPAVSTGTPPADNDIDAPPRLTLTTVEERRKQVEQSNLAEDVKTAALGHYQQAKELLRRVEDAARKAAELRAEKDNAPQETARITEQLAQPVESHDPNVQKGAALADLEQLRLADEEELVAVRKAIADWEQRAQVRAERKPQMPALIEKAHQSLAEAREALTSPAPDGEAPAITQARRSEQEAYVHLLEQQIELYQIEKVRYEALSELFPLRRDLLIRSRNHLEKQCESWKKIVLEAGRREAARQVAEARRKLQETHPALRTLAERNAELAQLRTSLQDLLADTRTRLSRIGETLSQLETEFRKVQDKESRAGLTTAIGLLLRNQRNHLPDEDGCHSQQAHAVAEMTRLQLEQMPLEDERDALGDTASRAEEIMADMETTAGSSTNDTSEMALSLLNDRKQYLNDLLGDYDACIDELAELDVRSRKLIDTIREYRHYIDERVLWIRSSEVVGLSTPKRALSGLVDLAAPERWRRVVLSLYGDMVRTPSLAASFICLALFLLGLGARIRRWTRRLGDQDKKQAVVGVLRTVAALLLTLGTASVWPVLLWLIAGRLTSGIADEFGVAVGQSLRTTAIVFWSVEVFRQICRIGGIASRHLQWPEAALRSLRTSLLKVMTCGLPIVFGVSLTENWQDGLWSDSLGRILFVIGMGLLATSLRRILRPNGPVLCEAFRRSQDGWLCRGRRIWYPAVVSVPLVLAGLALAGFQFTAEQLLIRVEATFWLAIVLLIAFTLAMRWLLAMRKRVALEQARARQAAVLAAAQTGDASEELKVLPQVEEPTIDVSHLSLQMLRLVRVAACVLFLTGSWFIWGQVLPALQMFHGVELWNTTVQVSEEVELADGQIESRMVTKPRAVTLGILLLAAGLLLTAIVASRNIPGLLELAILQRLPLDHGARNAVTTLCRYLFSLGGIILAARMVGIGWSSVQWLIAALTVGLGFGLQEIFANFVSGLIILFERPVRIGDVVTIDGVSGVISRIQIRATTVTDFDRKEYLVPNKEFVTGRVLNWTLTDKTNRIVITVGVAYGSNTEHARNLLARVAEEHPLVLDDPAPVATFEGFGDSCLTLLLRCYLPNLDNRLKTITELHEAIDREFRNNDLEIAFPQRDIHIRSMTTVPLASHSSPSTLAAQSDERKAA